MTPPPMPSSAEFRRRNGARARARSSLVRYCCCVAIARIASTPPCDALLVPRSLPRRRTATAPSMSIGSDDYFSRRAMDWDDQRTGAGRSVYSYFEPGYEEGGGRRQGQRPPQSFVNGDDYYEVSNGDGRNWGEQRDNFWTISQQKQREYRQKKFTRDSQWPQSQRRDKSYQQRTEGNFGGKDYNERRRQNQIEAGRRGDSNSNASSEEFRGWGGKRAGNVAADAGWSRKRNYDDNSGRGVDGSAAGAAVNANARWNGISSRDAPPSSREFGRQIGFKERRQEFDVRDNRDPRRRRGRQQRHGADYYDDSPYGDSYASDDWPLATPDLNRDGKRQYPRQMFAEKKEDAVSGGSYDVDSRPKYYESKFGQNDLDSYYSDGPKSPQDREQYRGTSPSVGPTPGDVGQTNDYYPPPRPLSPDRIQNNGDVRPDQRYYESSSREKTPVIGTYGMQGDRVPSRTAKDNRTESRPTGIGYGGFNGGIKKFVNSFLYPFGNGSDKGDGNFLLEVKKMLSSERRIIEALAKEARRCILSDPELTSVLGEEIRLGAPFSKSSFQKESTDGGNMTSRRLRLGIPITGTRGRGGEEAKGGLWISAEKDVIARLEVIVGGRKFDVSVDGPPRRGVVDANVTKKKVYKY